MKEVRSRRYGPCLRVLLLSLWSIVSLYSLSQAQSREGRRPPPPMSLDKIRAEIDSIESKDEKLNRLVMLGNMQYRNLPDSLLAISQEIEMVQGANERKKKAYSLFMKANAWRLLNSDSAISYASKAADLLLDLNESSSFLMMENLLGLQYLQKREFLQAESLFLGAIEYGESLDSLPEYPIRNFYGNLGNLYVTVGAYDLAIDMFEKILEEADNPSNRCNILSRLSSSYAGLNEYERAISTLNPCLEYENLAPPIQSIVRSNLSSFYRNMGDTLMSISLQERASQVSYQYRIPNISISQMVNLGDYYLDMGRINDADSLARLLNGPEMQVSRPNEEIIKNQFFARLELKNNNPRKSITFADRSIDLASKNGLLPMLRDIYTIKAKAYEQLGELDKALENERLQMDHAKTQTDRANDQRMAMMTVRYQLQNKEEEIFNMSSELQSIKFRNVLIIIVLIMTASYIIYRYRLFYLLKEEKTRNRIAMDLHDDLSGTLSSISFFSAAARKVKSQDEDENARFLEMIDKSATEAKERIDDIIWAIDPSKDDWSVFLKKCKRFASDALDSKSIEYSIEVDDSFSVTANLELRQNLWLIFKEMVNNLIAHSEASEASISFMEKDKKIILEVCDDGKGFDPEQVHHRNGVKNIRSRAENINADLELTTAPGEGTCWKFQLKI